MIYDIQCRKTISLLISMKIELNIRRDRVVQRSNFKTTNLASLKKKQFKLHGIQFILSEIVNPNRRGTQHIYKSR